MSKQKSGKTLSDKIKVIWIDINVQVTTETKTGAISIIKGRRFSNFYNDWLRATDFDLRAQTLQSNLPFLQILSDTSLHKVHSFLKQCLNDLHFMKKSSPKNFLIKFTILLWRLHISSPTIIGPSQISCLIRHWHLIIV